jgi:hypothetical protein
MEKWQVDHVIYMLEVDVNYSEGLEAEYAAQLKNETDKGYSDGIFYWKRLIDGERRMRRLLQAHLDRVKRFHKESEKDGSLPTAL